MKYSPDWVLNLACSVITKRYVLENVPIESFTNIFSKALEPMYEDLTARAAGRHNRGRCACSPCLFGRGRPVHERQGRRARQVRTHARTHARVWWVGGWVGGRASASEGKCADKRTRRLRPRHVRGSGRAFLAGRQAGR